MLGLGFGRNRGEVSEIVVFTAVGNGFQIFRIAAVSNANTGDSSLFCHVNCLLLLHNGIIGKLIPGDPAALFHKTDDSLCISICLRNLIQGLLYKFFPSICQSLLSLSFCRSAENMQVYKDQTGMI